MSTRTTFWRLLNLQVALSSIWCGLSIVSSGGNGWGDERHGLVAGMEMKSKDHPNVQCIGRFQLTVPDPMVVAGRSQSIYDVDVRTLLIPPGGIDVLWNARLAKIRPIAPDKEFHPASFRTFELLPGTRAVWFIGNPSSPQLREIEALMPSGNHAVLIVTGGEAGKEPVVENLVRIVLNSYVSSTTQGFCVGDGAVTSVPGVDEQTLISLDHMKVEDFEIRFETQNISGEGAEAYSDQGEEKETSHSGDARMSVLRDGPRVVAALEGKESEIFLAPPQESALVRLTWHFPGVPGNTSKPMINIVAMCPAKYRAELEKIWDALLNSVQPVPPSPQRSQ
jgi:hypothetical protein